MATYRVDTVPWLLKPVYVPMTWIVGVVLFGYYTLCRMTSRVSIDGPGNHDLSQHAIFCFWHESWLSYCVVFNRYRSPHTMISHPAAYMRPLHIQFRLMGLTPLVLGSSGEEGRRAADAVAALVGRGLSTSISPRRTLWPAACAEERRAPHRAEERCADCAPHDPRVARP